MADTATYIGSDAASAGNWKGVYGSLGFNVLGDLADYQSWVSVTPTGHSLYVWSSDSIDARALQKATSSDPSARISASWWSYTSFSVNLSISDAGVHRVALYLVDWDRRGRTCRVDVLDSLGAVLDTRSVADYRSGTYLVWDVSGNVTFRFVNTGAYDVELNGIFFDGSGTPPEPGLTQEHAIVGKQVDNTQSITAEHALISKQVDNTQSITTEHIIVNGWPPNEQKFTQMFVVIGLHDAPPVPMAQLTVNKVVVPPGDTGRFNLLVDGSPKANDVGDGGTTGIVDLTAGPHTVSESGSSGTDVRNYDTVIGGDAAPDGSITLAEGESKVVVITNTRKAEPPPPIPPTPPSTCPPAFTLRRVAVTLRRVTHLPVRGADN